MSLVQPCIRGQFQLLDTDPGQVELNVESFAAVVNCCIVSGNADRFVLCETRFVSSSPHDPPFRMKRSDGAAMAERRDGYQICTRDNQLVSLAKTRRNPSVSCRI